MSNRKAPGGPGGSNEPHNFIHVRATEDKDSLILTIVIRGTPMAWIAYDHAQLGGLIEALTAAREELNHD